MSGKQVDMQRPSFPAIEVQDLIEILSLPAMRNGSGTHIDAPSQSASCPFMSPGTCALGMQ
jgi:hypothetical protein